MQKVSALLVRKKEFVAASLQMAIEQAAAIQ